MSDPFVSVIIPTFNRREKCRRAIESVQNQTFQNFELIVVDDGSTDGINENIIAGKDKKGQYFYIQLSNNLGVSRARNLGVAQARGEWIAFLDSDDQWFPKKLEKQVDWLHNHPEYVIHQTKEIWIRNGVRVNPPKTHEKKSGNIFKQSLERCFITPSSVMMKKSIFHELGGFNESFPACEDYDLWIRLTCKYPVGLVDDFLLTRFGGHEDQLSSTVKTLDKYRIRALLQLLSSKPLTQEQNQYALKILVKKAQIVANGLKKRKKIKEYERFRKIANTYREFI